jgi:hypothetical protein
VDSTVARFQSSGFLYVETTKHLVPAAPDDNKETLHGIVNACQALRNCPGISARMRRSMMTESRGGHFEHSYKCTPSALTQ